MQQYDGQNVGVLSRLANSFYRHRWLFLLAVFAVTGVTTAVVKFRKETYKATAQTQVVGDNQQLVDALGEQAGYQNINGAQLNVNQFNDMMGDDRPDGFLDTALKSAQLDRPISVDPRDADPRFDTLRKRLVATAESDALFTITLTWDNPQECERIVWALQKQFIEETGLNRQAKAIATTKFLESEMKRYSDKMREAEQALIDYKKNNAGELPESQASDLQQLSQLKTQRDTLLISAEDSALKRQALEEHISQLRPLSVLAKTLADGPTAIAVRNLKASRAELIAQKYLPGSDKVSFIDQQISDLEQKEKSEVMQGQAPGMVVTKTDLRDNPEFMTLDRDLTLARIAERTQLSELALINNKISDYEARAVKIPEAQKILNDKTRGYTFYKTQYDSLVERREQALLKANLDKITARSTLQQVGTIYAEPSTPKSKQTIMFLASILGGLLVGVAVVIFSEWSDQTLRYGADVERILGLPLLAEVPETRAALPPAPSVPPAAPRPGNLRGAR